MAVNKHGNDIPCMYFVCRCEILQRHTRTLSHALEHAMARFGNGMLHHHLKKEAPKPKLKKGFSGNRGLCAVKTCQTFPPS